MLVSVHYKSFIIMSTRKGPSPFLKTSLGRKEQRASLWCLQEEEEEEEEENDGGKRRNKAKTKKTNPSTVFFLRLCPGIISRGAALIPSTAAALITVRQLPRAVVASNFRSLRNTGLSHPHQQRKGSCCVDDTDTVAAGQYTPVLERAAKAVCTAS